MNEAQKTIAVMSNIEKEMFKGEGIDIGCGPKPAFENAIGFDLKDGDANYITEHVDKQFDFVFSSHCLEHMVDPITALYEWWKLVKPGGYLYIVVPDEDLYEQGCFPSRFNSDHKWTFTICKDKSWSPKSCNLFNMARVLPDAHIINISLQDYGYDRNKRGIDQTLSAAMAQIKLIARKRGSPV